MSTTVGFEGTSPTQVFPEYTDSASVSSGGNGYTLCGARTYAITSILPTPNPTNPEFLTLNTATRTLTLDTDT